MKTDILVAGCGCSGLYLALNLPKDKEILIVTKSDAESNDSYLAQGGMCVLTREDDYDAYFEDTLAAGHYENDRKSVEIMIRSSQDVLKDLIGWGADFKKDADGNLLYTREGAHSAKRIVFHEDVTGKEITSHLLAEARKRENIKIMEYTTLVDIVSADNVCYGGILCMADGTLEKVSAEEVVLATGGVGGVYRHSTNFRHLTGDGVAMAIKHGVELKDITYVQIHPTTFYSTEKEQRSFLISESVRGEGAKLYDKYGNRFVNELLPRDLLTQEICKQMEKDGTDYVWEDLREIPAEELDSHFPNIIEHCRQMGYDVHKECIPVVPAQHYFMGGIKVNHESKTSMEHLYAVGETACNGVHGKNRLASNSLLESLVFAKRAALDMTENPGKREEDAGRRIMDAIDLSTYEDREALEEEYRSMVQQAVKASA
ncbi:MAG: L-aspartate oxidase [Roseburia lenta]|nr:L-aspartate oxidase [Roseburia lenta]